MITIYEPKAESFAGMGLGSIDPIECKIEEEAGGMYELTLTQPMDGSGRDWLIDNGRIIKAPAPVRETPLVQLGLNGQTVDRQIYKTTKKTYLRKSAPSGKKLKTIKKGVEAIKIGQSGTWYQVILVKGGKSGWIDGNAMAYSRTQAETVREDNPGTVIEQGLAEEQLFRVTVVRRKSKARRVEVEAQHISYDLKGVYVKSEYKPEGVPADEVITQIIARQDHAHEFNIYCSCTDAISADYTGRNLIDCLLAPEDGVVAQCKARLVRDNYDLFILTGDQQRKTGAEIRFGKNMLDAELETDTSEVVTRIRPIGKKRNGDPLYMTENGGYVDSPRIAEYGEIYAKDIEYDVQVGKGGVSSEAAARAKLKACAEKDYADGIDGAAAKLNAEFVREELTEEYREMANMWALHMYDVVPVIDSYAGIRGKLRMTWYEFDALLGEYSDTELGEIVEMTPTVYGFEIGGKISGSSIANGSIDGDAKIRNLSIGMAKITTATIEQLAVNALTALVAKFGEITAEKLTTDELYTSFAEMMALKVGTIDAASIETDTLAAEIARVAVLMAGSAEFDRATIAHLVAQAMHLEYGEAGRVFVRNLAVEYAQMIGATIGNLCIKASDGGYYAIDVDADGNVTATKVSVSESEIDAGQTDDGRVILETEMTVAELNTTTLKGSYALLNKIDAARIDVDALFAREGFIELLRTKEIVGNKSISVMVEDISMAAEAAEEAQALAVYSSAEPPDAPIEADKLWQDLGTTPPLLRSWIGDDVSNDRAYQESAGGQVVEIRRAGRVMSFDALRSSFAPTQAGSGTPYPPGGGKNLFNFATAEVRRGSFDANGTFTVSASSDGNQYNYAFQELNASGAVINNNVIFYSAGATRYTRTITLNANTVRLCLRIFGTQEAAFWLDSVHLPGGTTVTLSFDMLDDTPGAQVISNIQLEVSSEATAYAPYSNIRPIEGRTGLALLQCGKNLFNFADASVQRGSFDEGGTFTASAEADGNQYNYGFQEWAGRDTIVSHNIIVYSPGATRYTRTIALNASTTDLCLRIFGKQESAIWWNDINLPGGTTLTLSFDMLDDTPGAQVISNIQVEIGAANTAFEAYAENVYAAELGQTVYGGTFEWRSGALTAERARVTLDGSEDWGFSEDGGKAHLYLALGASGKAGDTSELCSHLVRAAGSAVSDLAGNDFFVSGAVLYMSAVQGATSFADAAGFKDYLAAQHAAGTPVQLAYALAVPQTMQLAGRNILPLDAAANVLRADGAALELEYTASGWQVVNDPEIYEAAQAALAQRTALLEAEQRKLGMCFDFQQADGLHVHRAYDPLKGEAKPACETLMADDSFNVLVNGQTSMKVAASYQAVGDQIIVRSVSSGLIIGG